MSDSFLPKRIQQMMDKAIRDVLEPYAVNDRQAELTARLGQVTCSEDLPPLLGGGHGDEAHALENLPCKDCGAAI